MANLPKVPRWMTDAPPAYHRKLAACSDEQLERLIKRNETFWNNCYDHVQAVQRLLRIADRRATKARNRWHAAQEERDRRKAVANG